jgi:hypothetical protein
VPKPKIHASPCRHATDGASRQWSVSDFGVNQKDLALRSGSGLSIAADLGATPCAGATCSTNICTCAQR